MVCFTFSSCLASSLECGGGRSLDREESKEWLEVLIHRDVCLSSELSFCTYRDLFLTLGQTRQLCHLVTLHFGINSISSHFHTHHYCSSLFLPLSVPTEMVAIDYNYHCDCFFKKVLSALSSSELSPSYAAIYRKVYLKNSLHKLFNFLLTFIPFV